MSRRCSASGSSWRRGGLRGGRREHGPALGDGTAGAGAVPGDLIHNLIHLAFGVWGLAASRSWGAAKTYCQAAGVTYLVLMVMGFIAPDTFGLVPIGGNDIWLHAVLGIPLAYFGFTARSAVPAGTRV